MTTSVPCPGVVVRGADAEVLAFPGGSLMSLLAEGAGTSATMTLHRSLLRSGAEGAGPHHHESTTELIIVVSGLLELMVGEHRHSVSVGDVAIIPPGVTHAFRAAPGCDADVFDVVTPGIERFEMFRELSRAALGAARPSLDDPTNYDTYTDDRPDWGTPSPPPARCDGCDADAARVLHREILRPILWVMTRFGGRNYNRRQSGSFLHEWSGANPTSDLALSLA